MATTIRPARPPARRRTVSLGTAITPRRAGPDRPRRPARARSVVEGHQFIYGLGQPADQRRPHPRAGLRLCGAGGARPDGPRTRPGTGRRRRPAGPLACGRRPLRRQPGRGPHPADHLGLRGHRAHRSGRADLDAAADLPRRDDGDGRARAAPADRHDLGPGGPQTSALRDVAPDPPLHLPGRRPVLRARVRHRRRLPGHPGRGCSGSASTSSSPRCCSGTAPSPRC